MFATACLIPGHFFVHNWLTLLTLNIHHWEVLRRCNPVPDGRQVACRPLMRLFHMSDEGLGCAERVSKVAQAA